MSDLKEPLEAWTEEERRLLQSAAGDRASNESRAATLALLGLSGAATLGASPVAAAASSSIAPAAKGIAAWTLVKWCSVVAVSVGVVGGGVYSVERTTRSAQQSAAVFASIRPAPAAMPARPSAPAVETPVVEAPIASAAQPKPHASAQPASEPDLHQEIAVIDQARTALSSGDPQRALALLQSYSRDYPRGTLGPEATLLKIQAWVALGDRARARSVGRAFLVAHPKSPLAARVHTLIGE